MAEPSITKGAPKVGDLVIASIAKVMPYGAYCKLLEYDNTEVFLPIKEVSSGWIKNIREFIHEGQKVVVKVIFFDKERQTLDVSMKKVTPADSKAKINTYNLEKRLSALFLRSVHQAGLDSQKAELVKLVPAAFPTYTELFRNAEANTKEFADSEIPKKLRDTILSLLETSRKKKKYIVSYVMKLTSYDAKAGATEIRGILSAVRDKGIDVRYISAPKYHLTAEGKDYAEAEAKIKGAVETVNAKLKKGLFEIEKEKIKKEKEDIMSKL